MNCPTCGRRGQVTDSRPLKSGGRYRRYACSQGHRFTTHEHLRRDDRH